MPSDAYVPAQLPKEHRDALKRILYAISTAQQLFPAFDERWGELNELAAEIERMLGIK